MKTKNLGLRVLLLLALAGMGGLAVVALQLRGERAMLAREMELAQAEITGLGTDLRAVKQMRDALGGETAAQSNRADEAVAGLAEERKIHDPLRRQIEKMIEASINSSAQLETARDQERKQQAELAQLREQLDSVGVTKSDLEHRLTDLREAGRNAENEHSQLQSKLEQVEKAAGEFAARVKQLEAELAESKAAEAVLRKQLADAAQREVELKKALAAKPVAAPAAE